MSANLHGEELNYLTIDKQAHDVFKLVKHFRPYIFKNLTRVIAPHPIIRSYFLQQELGERIWNWMTTIHEYDIEFKPTNIVCGEGLCKKLAT
jgi:hypothetical protein